MTVQRWRASKGTINKVKMEVSPRGKWVAYADYLALHADSVAEIDRLRAELAKSDREWYGKLEAADAEHDAALALLREIAAIAHNGGMLGLSASDALILIRRATLEHFDRGETPTKACANVRAARSRIDALIGGSNG